MPRHHTVYGRGYVRLSALALPSAAVSTTPNFPTSNAFGTSTAWAALPAVPITTSFDVSNGEAVLLLADISYVRHNSPNRNTFFRIVVDGTIEVALSNTGHSQGWAYASLSFHGVASGLSIGSHTAELQVRLCHSPLLSTASF